MYVYMTYSLWNTHYNMSVHTFNQIFAKPIPSFIYAIFKVKIHIF
jgi:hypothetical protein